MLKHPVVMDSQVQGKGTAIRESQARSLVMEEHEISQLFVSYFHNKMTLLLFLIQAKRVKPNPKLVERVCCFLEDLFHHMLEGRLQKRYRLTFKWLERFFVKLPEVTVDQRDKAIELIRAIYDVFGLHLKEDL